MQSIGLIEAYGIIAAINAADAMCKSAGVTLAGYKKIGSAMVTVYVVGEVAAVNIAVEAGVEAANRVGKVISSLVIARPEKSVIDSLNELGSKKGKRKSFLHKKAAFASKAKSTIKNTPIAKVESTSPRVVVAASETKPTEQPLKVELPVAPVQLEVSAQPVETKTRQEPVVKPADNQTKVKTKISKKSALAIKVAKKNTTDKKF